MRPKTGRPGVWEVDRNAGRAAADLAARQTLWELFAPPPAPLVPAPERDTPHEAEARPAEPIDRLLARLRAHAAVLHGPAALAAAVEEALTVPGGPSAETNRRAIHAFCDAAGGSLDPAALLSFAPFWMREPAAFIPPEDLADPLALGPMVVNHLFGRYAIPIVLAPAFASAPEEGDDATKWMRWAVALGGGAGLRKAGRALGPTFGWEAPGRFQSHFEREGARLGRFPGGPLAAAIRAETSRVGGDEIVARRLLGVRFYRLDPTALPADDAAKAKRAFWTAAVGWLATRGAELTDPDARDVLAWAAERFERVGFAGLPCAKAGGFVWRGRSAKGALAAVRQEAERKAAAVAAQRERERLARAAAERLDRQNRRALRREAERIAQQQRRTAPAPALPGKWEPHGWDWEWKCHGSRWRFIERTTARALVAEGRALKHCAGSYVGRCGAGLSAVYSLTLNGAPRLTIEIRPDTGRVVQVRGADNRPPTPEEAIVVERWHRRCRRRRRHG
ncbi:hypothetical protein LzC2_40150 [Planctomycetes bacterium LzC2]|uniref:PcfJ-like protein n=2 Tax=Alienimonas chondri TaxID=2681879 RepID=A0ABX1VJI4_9PLAN|nr:hypothetical protein [Alienimonas chondri]